MQGDDRRGGSFVAFRSLLVWRLLRETRMENWFGKFRVQRHVRVEDTEGGCIVCMLMKEVILKCLCCSTTWVAVEGFTFCRMFENRSSRFPRNTFHRWIYDFIIVRKNWNEKFKVKSNDKICLLIKLYEYVSYNNFTIYFKLNNFIFLPESRIFDSVHNFFVIL